MGGGGPPGRAPAPGAAAGGLRVVVHERNAAIGEPVRTSGGSFIEPLRRLGVPDDCWHPVHKIRVIGPTTDVVKTYRKPVGCVLDVRRTYQWLGARAVDAGAEIRLKSPVEGLRRDGRGGVVGLRARDPVGGRYDVEARDVGDPRGHTGFPGRGGGGPSGHSVFLAREAGLRPGNDRSAVGMEVELRAPGYDSPEAVF